MYIFLLKAVIATNYLLFTLIKYDLWKRFEAYCMIPFVPNSIPPLGLFFQSLCFISVFFLFFILIFHWSVGYVQLVSCVQRNDLVIHKHFFFPDSFPLQPITRNCIYLWAETHLGDMLKDFHVRILDWGPGMFIFSPSSHPKRFWCEWFIIKLREMLW